MRTFDLDDGGARFVDERKPRLPTRQEIDAMTDVAALESLDERVATEMAKIETDLEFRDGTDEWRARARSALTAHRICRDNVARRFRQLRPKKAPVVEDPTTKLERARLNLERQASAEAAAKARRAVKIDAGKRAVEIQRIAQQKRAVQAIHATSLGHAFLHNALSILPPETFAYILRRATEAVEHAQADLMPEASAELGSEP